VASLAQLVASPTLSSLLGYVARPRSDAEVERVALIEDGAISAIGTHHDLMASNPVYRALLSQAAEEAAS